MPHKSISAYTKSLNREVYNDASQDARYNANNKKISLTGKKQNRILSIFEPISVEAIKKALFHPSPRGTAACGPFNKISLFCIIARGPEPIEDNEMRRLQQPVVSYS